MRKLFFTISLLTSISLFATNYYVSPTGSSSNNGLSPATAKDDIEEAGLLTSPGDTVFVMNGTYSWYNPNSDVVDIYNSGTANNWIVFINYPGHHPLIKSKNWAAISIQGADYVEVNGFEVIGNADSVTLAYAQSQQNNTNNPITSGNGIGCRSQYSNPSNLSHHIIIRNCKVSKCPGGGIFTYNADYIRIENNIVSECAWYAPFGNSGISLYQNWNSDSSTATKNFVVGNTCYRNENYIPFFASGSITDGNGIIIDDERNTQNGSTLGIYAGKTYIANNLVFDNGGRGIHCYESDKVIIVNNTAYKNCQSPAVKDGEYTAYSADSISFINNIAFPISGVPPVSKSSTSTTHLIVDHNLWAANSGIANPLGTNTITTPPNFILPSANPLLADFHLQARSTAINKGTHKQAPANDKDGNIRVSTDSVDIGCYEYPRVLPLTILYFAGNNANQNNILNWRTSAEINSSHFEIERSTNGFDFIKVGRMESYRSNTTYHSYSYIDSNCPIGISYYRLKQVDINGSYKYSDVVLLKRTPNGSLINIWPNPAVDNIDILIDNTQINSVEIYNNIGQKRLIQNTTIGKCSIDISRLACGTYFLKIYSNRNLFGQTKFIKIRSL